MWVHCLPMYIHVAMSEYLGLCILGNKSRALSGTCQAKTCLRIYADSEVHDQPAHVQNHWILRNV